MVPVFHAVDDAREPGDACELTGRKRALSAPPPGHPERPVPDVPLTEAERLLWMDLRDIPLQDLR
jgi:hypothetical protein